MHLGSDRTSMTSSGCQVVFTNIWDFPHHHLLFAVRGGVPRRFLRAQKVIITAKDDVRRRWPHLLLFSRRRAEAGDGMALQGHFREYHKFSVPLCEFGYDMHPQILLARPRWIVIDHTQTYQCVRKKTQAFFTRYVSKLVQVSGKSQVLLGQACQVKPSRDLSKGKSSPKSQVEQERAVSWMC